MGKTWGIIHPESKFLSSCEPVNPDNLCTSKIQWQIGTGQILLFQKGDRKEEMVLDGSQAGPKPHKASSIRSYGFTIILFGSMSHRPGPLGWQYYPHTVLCNCPVLWNQKGTDIWPLNFWGGYSLETSACLELDKSITWFCRIQKVQQFFLCLF